MKKVIAIVLVVLFFLIVLAAIIFKLIVPSTKTTSAPPVQYPVATTAVGVTDQDPQQFVKDFYSWYLLNMSRSPQFPYTDDLSKLMGPWLTADFIANWDADLSDSGGLDPVLLIPSNPPAAGTTISTQVVSQSVRSETVYVALDTTHTYDVTVTRSTTDGTWKIASVSPHQ